MSIASESPVPRRSAGVLEGVLVIDFTQAIAGPFATRVLADMGARVVKIESLNGDLVRGVQCRPDKGWGPMFGHGSAGKESVSVDIRRPEGRHVVDRLLDLADIIVENFRPGTLERLGFDPLALVDRPNRPIVCSVSGFGRGTEQSAWSATDPLGQAFAGMTFMIGNEGERPFLAANGIADTATAMSAATAILGAMIGRQRDGRGRYLDIAMADVMLAMDCVTNPVAAAFDDVKWQPLGHDHPAVCPFGVFKAADGYVVIQGMGGGRESTWGKLCMAIGDEDLIVDPRTAAESARLQNREFVNERIQKWVTPRTREQTVHELQSAGAIAGPVLTPREAVTHPFYAARGALSGVPVELPGAAATRLMVATPFGKANLTGQPRRPPMLGENTRSVLEGLLQMPPEEVEKLYMQGVVQTRLEWP